MFLSKKLFFTTLIVGALLFGVSTISFILYAEKSYKEIGIFFIFNSVLAGSMYSLLFFSLKKVAIVKAIYLISIFLCIVILSLGIIIIA